MVDNASTDGTPRDSGGISTARDSDHLQRSTTLGSRRRRTRPSARGRRGVGADPESRRPAAAGLPAQSCWTPGTSDPKAGAVCGKLLSIGPGFKPLRRSRASIPPASTSRPPCATSTAAGTNPTARRFDRPEYVFGASAAAALYRREMIDDVSVDGDFFDPDFFVYREDADVAWRAQLLGWRCIYTPAAVALSRAHRDPGNRRAAARGFINMHSVKNRFLMRIKNVTAGLYRRYWLPMTLRDLMVVGGTVFWEPTSLAAFWQSPNACRGLWPGAGLLWLAGAYPTRSWHAGSASIRWLSRRRPPPCPRPRVMCRTWREGRSVPVPFRVSHLATAHPRCYPSTRSRHHAHRARSRGSESGLPGDRSPD